MSLSSKSCPGMAPPDVTFVFAEDVLEWDRYLSRQFEGSGAVLHHEQVERMAFPLASARQALLAEARVVLVILSPALVAFLDARASEGFQLTRLLRPGRTIAMLCGVSEGGLAGIKDVLISYDDWRHLEAKDKDITMVRQCIEMIHEMLIQSKENERINKPKFKLVPRKVQEGNGKVYIMLTKPLENSTQVRVTLEANGAKEVLVKRRNPYTLVFVIPDEMIQSQPMVNVHVWCGDSLLGVDPIKCVTKMGELYSLMASVNSPYEFLCNTLGMSVLYDVDTHLSSAFRENCPKSGFDLLHKDIRQDKIRRTKEEYPTLLHFAASHGLYQLVKELLKCPNALLAVSLKNSRGQTPAQLANHAGHNEVVAALEDFLKSPNSSKNLNIESTVPAPSSNAPEQERKCSNPIDYYDIPAHPVPVLHLPANTNVKNELNDRDSDYMKMHGSHKENVEPNNRNDGLIQRSETPAEFFRPFSPADKKLSLLESQAKLIEIMEAYKKGASLTEVEQMHNEWKLLYQVSDQEAKSTLDGLRNLYAKAQKAKLNKKHSTSFSELRQCLYNKLRRKDSVGSKGNSSRKNSKDMSTEKPNTESEQTRPVSTLSVLSNTSSSSGSSFDRLSTTSAGSDSGHHSDFGDDRTSRFKDRFESRYNLHKRTPTSPSNTLSLQKNMQLLSLASKPPAPPPRPTKPSRYGSLEDCKHSDFLDFDLSKRLVPPSFEESLKLMDYIQPDPKSATLTNDFRTRKSSFSDFLFEDPNANYDCPPPPRLNLSAVKPPVKNPPPAAISPKTDYDLVPPPLPVSSPPKKMDKQHSLDFDLSYDIPNSNALVQALQNLNEACLNYDFPKTTMMDNTDTRATCTCQNNPNSNNNCSVKSCCVGSKLSSLESVQCLPSVPNSDVALKVERNSSKFENVKKCPTVKSQYYNVILRSPKEVEIDVSHRDSIPEEMAPPPPIYDGGSEEHYKLVGAPIPVPAK